MCQSLCEWRPDVNRDRGSHGTWSFLFFPKLAGPWVSHAWNPPVTAPPALGLGMSLLYLAFIRVLGIQTQALMPVWKDFTLWTISQSLLEDFFSISKTHSLSISRLKPGSPSVLLVYALLQSWKNHIPEPVGKGSLEASGRQLQTVFTVIAVYFFLNFVSFLFFKKNLLKIELHHFSSSQVSSPQPLPCPWLRNW